jgi:hypothetical protein
MVCPERSEVAGLQLGRRTVDETTPTLVIEPLEFDWPFSWIADAVPGPSILPRGEDIRVDDRSFIEVLISECVVLSLWRIARNALFIALRWGRAKSFTFISFRGP